MTPYLQPAIDAILATRERVPAERAALIAISGIDASGQGYLTAQLAKQLTAGHRVANINIDGWLNLPPVRFNQAIPAQHFYLNAIRFDAMFDELVLPLRRERQVNLTMDFAAETAQEFRKERIQFENIDIILLEGIYLLKRESFSAATTTLFGSIAASRPL